MSSSAVPTICKICEEHCGILVSDDGQTATISGNRSHPVSKGFVCVKGKHFGEVHHSPHRLTKPLLKKNSGWEELSFDDALDVLASNFLRCKRDFGAESVVLLKGEGLKHFEIAQYMRHLANGFGSPNYISIGSLCHYSQMLGHSLTYGGKPIPDFERIGVAVIWGANPAVSYPRMFGELRKAVRQGTRLVVIDPTYTQTAELAHAHLRVRPGSDGFLALALMKHAIEDKGIRPKDDLTEGWDDLVALVKQLEYDTLLKRADVGTTEFMEMTSLIFDNLPGWTTVGLGLEHHPGGVQAIRAAACLQSMLDPENRPVHISAELNPLPGVDRYPQMTAPIGASETPLFTGGRREGQGMLLTRAIMEGEPYAVRAMLIAGSNPMMTFPCVGRQGESLNKLDFLAVSELFMTPTARLADLVLPAADHLDNTELHDYGRIGKPYLGLMHPSTVSRKGWPTWKLVFELARRLDLGYLFPWDDNRDAIADRLSGAGVNLDDLENSPSATASYPYEMPGDERWHTHDGKLHYRSEALRETGNEALPVPDALALPYETDDSYPFWLSTGDRVAPYQHAQFRQIPVYKNMVPEPILEIHPNAASRLGVQSGEPVVLSTRNGSLEIPARVSPELREDCLRMIHGWEQANANELTGLDHFDRVSGFPWLRALPARVEKKTSPT